MKKLRVFLSGCLSLFMLFTYIVPTYAEDNVVANGTQKVYIVGEDWGPAVEKTIITLDKTIDGNSLDATDFEIVERKQVMNWTTFTKEEGIADREVLNVYLSDANGNAISETTGSIVTIEMAISPNDGSPFIYDILDGGLNKWCAFYKLEISLSDSAVVTSQGSTLSTLNVAEEIDLTDVSQRICEVADTFNLDSFRASSGQDYSYGEYVPTMGTGKRPLVIWLHGAGEGGSDNYIDLLGNEVTSLASAEFQNVFNGAYILTPQSPTMWLDGSGGGANPSKYTADLKELIDDYVENNPNIDPDRIIIGGCSNGGYMTMEMILTYPEYFAAAYPICEAYGNQYITDDQIQSLVDNEVGIWFIHALADTTVNPNNNTLPAYERLIAAGATNVHKTIMDKVLDTTGRYTDDAGDPYEYNGHWSWIWFFNNECTCDECEDNAWTWLSKQTKAEENIVTGNQKAYIIGEDWGPAVEKTIITLDKEIDASSLDATDFTIKEIKEVVDWSTAPNFDRVEGIAERQVLDVYLSDANGNRVSTENTKGNTITIEMYVSPNDGSPFLYDVPSGLNNWCEYYKLEISLASEVTTNGTPITTLDVEKEIDLKDESQRICIGADEFNLHTYNATSGRNYSYGEYIPTQGSEKRPLVIWLHGAGEGGTDNYIDLLGNEVTSLVSDDFQKLFEGAYILTPQSPTMWMDDGQGNYQSGDIGSMYTEDLMELIDSYVKGNPNIDKNRIIIGGCSNGGYMTMEMILTYPEYFAAAYPICEAFSDEFITDDQIQGLIDNEVGIWFTHALNDTTVNPNETTIPTYERLLEAGATNVHISLFDNVVDTTGRFPAITRSNAYEYNGHWSWIYFFNNECTCDECEDNAWEWLSVQTKAADITEPTNPVTPTTPNGPTSSNSVTTGDIMNTTVFMALCLLSIAGIYTGYKRKNRKEL
ncbi:MAG: prolyl oligopeptidase family serine peptidase [Coprobacillaceae bacterium]